MRILILLQSNLALKMADWKPASATRIGRIDLKLRKPFPNSHGLPINLDHGEEEFEAILGFAYGRDGPEVASFAIPLSVSVLTDWRSRTHSLSAFPSTSHSQPSIERFVTVKR